MKNLIEGEHPSLHPVNNNLQILAVCQFAG